MQFQSHSFSHLTLTMLDEADCEADLRRSRAVLEDVLGQTVDLLAYPRGRHDERVRRCAERAGYRYAFSLPEATEQVTRHSIPRVGLYPGNGVTTLRLKCSRPYLTLRTSGAYNRFRRSVLASRLTSGRRSSE